MKFSLSICQIEFFTAPAQAVGLRPGHNFLTWVSTGLEHGQFAGHTFDHPAPFLAVTFAREPLTYTFSPGRQNWIISFLSPDIRPGRQPNLMEIRHDKGWIPAPRVVFLSPLEEVPLTAHFQQMAVAFAQPTPPHLFGVETGILKLLQTFLMPNRAPDPSPIALALRHQLEDRRLLNRNLADLAAAAGYSKDYLSLLFKREFGIAPLAYRNRFRMQTAASLLTSGKMSIKEIADELGFRHLSHFSGMFRRTFGTSPRAVRRHAQAP